jgi:phage terminase large subunit-like protein
VDSVFVRHVSGGISRVYFKSYEKGRSKLQGETLDWAALDEEPPEDIYTEVLTRTNATKGMVWITFTPLLGMSAVVRKFLMDPGPDRLDINMTIDDVEHYTPEERARIIASYPAHEREARAKGIPVMGSGLIFPVMEESIVCEPFSLPDLWPRICGIDFGYDHKTAIVWLAWDRDKDVIYLYHTVAMREAIPREIAPLILQQGQWVPCAWPHDGLQHDKGSGIQLAQQYRDQGVNMLHEMAQLPETGDENGYKVSRVSVEAGVLEMLNRMQTGRWKVFSNQVDWLAERQLYHRKDGKIVKEGDDVISASRYAMMMLRYAITPPDPHKAMLDPKRKGDWRV